MAVTAWLGAFALLVSAGTAAGRSVPVGPQPQPQLPPVPGYIPVYIQSGDSPPDVQRLYESRLAAHASAPAPVHAAPPPPAPGRRTGGQEAAAVPGGEAAPAASSGPRPRPQGDAPPPRSRLPAPHREASAPVPGPVVNSRITKKGAAGPAPALTAAPAPADVPVPQKPQNVKNAAKKRAGTRVQYQQQKAAAQTRKRQQQQRSFRQQQQQPQQQQQR